MQFISSPKKGKTKFRRRRSRITLNTIKSKKFTRTMALLLAVLTVFSILPVSALAAPNGNDNVTPDIILDENNDIVTGKRFKAPGFRIALTFL